MADDVELIGITRRFGSQVAVDNISFSVPAGSFFSLLGPSGCGKSTTLRMISGFDDPDAGVLRIAGLDMRGVPPERRPTNMVFQRWALFPHMTVRENVAFGLEMQRVPRPEISRRVHDSLEMVGLVEKAGQKPGQLSGGQMQRVALARALVRRPKVLLLDEPLGALDLKLRAQLQIELKRIQREVGATFVYVTHDQGEAMVMSDQIAIMRAGRIEQIGAPRAIYDVPQTAFVAAFVGNTNLIDVSVDGLDGKVAHVRAGGVCFTAIASGGVTAGRPGKISIRYERIRVGATAAGLGATARATIRDTVFIGSVLQYVLRLTDGPEMTAEVPYDGIHPVYAPGESVAVGWEPSGALLFADA